VGVWIKNVNVWQGGKKYNGNICSTCRFKKDYEHMNEWMKNVLDEKFTMGTL
jgi:hypothetical protein